MNLYLFYFLSFVAVLSALLVVFSRNPVYAVLYLIITFFSIAAHYFVLLNAEFIAAVHVIVYAGAIMVLFLYVIMLLNLNTSAEPTKPVLYRIVITLISGLLMVVLIAALKGTGELPISLEDQRGIGLVQALGNVLFTEFLLPFEICSILLLAAMVGAVLLGKQKKREA